MKKKHKLFLLSTLAVICLCLGLTAINEEPKQVQAAVTPYYTATFDYKLHYTVDLSTTVKTSKTGVTSATVNTNQYGTTTVKFYIWGSSSSGTGTFTSGSTITSSTVNIKVEGTFANRNFSVTNSSGTVVGTHTDGLITMTGLADGNYRVGFEGWSSGWNPTPRSYASYKTTAEFNFSVDAHAPVVTGGSTSISGKYTNTAFTITASDTFSGLKYLYMKTPGASSFTAKSSPVTVANTATNGLYTFYAEDKAGNKTANYYVFLDTVIPTGSVRTTSGTTVANGSYTNKAFTYTATDTGSGISSMQYQKPTSTSWLTYTSGTEVSGVNGTYKFRAIDKAGNYSAETSVILDTLIPSTTIYGGTSVLSGTATSVDSIMFSASDNLSGIKECYIMLPNASTYSICQNGASYSTNGTYSFYCVDNAGNYSATRVMTLDNTEPALSCEQTSFGGSCDGDFTVKVVDSISDFEFYWKSPTMTNYELVSGNSKTIYDTKTEGKYYFYAVDDLGNTTNTVWIELKLIYPEAEIVKEITTNRTKAIWEEESTTATINGSYYMNGSWVTEEGDYTITLTNAKGRKKTYTFSIGHYYVTGEVVEPTCITGGQTTYNCVSCSSSYISDYLPPLGHDYRTQTVDVTCVTDGGIVHTCFRCNDEYTTDRVLATGHIYAEEKIEVNCTVDGCIRHYCLRCDFEYRTDVVKASGHSFVSEVRQTVTCTEEGQRYHVCEICGSDYTTYIPCFGHTYEITDTTTENGNVIRTYSCTVCTNTYVQDLGNQYEKVSDYIAFLFEQYAPYMWYVLLGTTGVWSAVMGVMIIVANKNEDKHKARRIVASYVIGLVIIAFITVACPYLVNGIAAFVTA